MKKFLIGIIGMGYVGLPLAVAFSKKYTTLGYDINNKRLDELKSGIDRTNELESQSLKKSLKNLSLTNNIQDFVSADFSIHHLLRSNNHCIVVSKISYSLASWLCTACNTS